jgi:hypothetical protein
MQFVGENDTCSLGEMEESTAKLLYAKTASCNKKTYYSYLIDNLKQNKDSRAVLYIN